MMRTILLTCTILTLGIAPAVASAQDAVTPLLTGPETLPARESTIAGYFTIEDEIDLFGIYRRGLGGGLDFGLRAGYSDGFGGAFHFGGELRYHLSDPTEDFPMGTGLVGGLQITLGDRASLISVPFGVSFGAEVGSRDKSILLFGIPFLSVDRIDPDTGASDTELEGGVEFGGRIEITRRLFFDSALRISSHDNSEVSLALGLGWR